MKNIYVIDEHISSKANGIGPFIKAFIACLQKMQVNITILSFNEEADEFDIKESKGIRKLIFPIFPTDHFPTYYRIINRYLRLYLEDAADNVFCFNHAPCKELFQTVRKSFPLSKLVFTIHDMGWTAILNGDQTPLAEIISSRKKKNIRRKYKYLLDFFDTETATYAIADAVVCLSQSTYDILKDIYRLNPGKIHLIPNGMKEKKIRMTEEEKNLFRQKMHIGAEEKIILYAGRLSAPKGIYPLVNAFARIVEQWPESRLVLAGSANEEWNIFHSRTSHLSPKITFTGFIPHNELEKWYQIADIGALPSYYEQCPYAAIEMMMYGLPLVVSDGNGLKDMFQDNVNAKVASIGNRHIEEEFTRHLYEALGELLNSESLRKQLGRKAKETFLSVFSFKPMYLRYYDFFNQLSS